MVAEILEALPVRPISTVTDEHDAGRLEEYFRQLGYEVQSESRGP